MLVKLPANWFAPNNHLYYKDPFGTEVPDELTVDAKGYSLLPVGTVVLKAKAEPVATPEPSLRDNDLSRASGASEDKAREEAEAARKANAEKIREELAKSKK